MKILCTLCAVLIAIGVSSPAAAEIYTVRAPACTTFSQGDDPSRHANLQEIASQGAGSDLRAAQSRNVHGYCSLRLSDGASIKRLVAHGIDDSANDIFFELRRSSYATDKYTSLTNFLSMNGATTWASDAVNVPVNNDSYGYFVYFWIPQQPDPSALRVWTVAVEYLP